MPNGLINSRDDFVFSSFKLEAEIEGFVDPITDIVSMSATFGLNMIPKASLVLATGINALTDNPASAHSLLDQIEMRAAVKVTLVIETTDGDLFRSPPQRVVVFEGYYAGFGFQRAQDNAQFTLHLVHWLDDLNQGSMLSRNFFPGSGYSLADNAVNWTIQAGQGRTGTIPPIPGLDPNGQHIKYANYTDDFWAKTIKPLFEVIAKWPRPDDTCAPKNEADPQDTIKKALAKMPGHATGFGGNAGVLALNFKNLVDQMNEATLDRTINNAMSQTGLAGFDYTTFWSVLVGMWGPMFLFGVSPSTTFANVIPYYGALRFDENDPNFKTIQADDYNYANFMANTGNILEAVAIYWASKSATNIIPGDSIRPLTKDQFCKPAGVYPPVDNRPHRGFVLIKEPPPWIGDTRATLAAGSSGLVNRPTGDIHTPTAGDNSTPGGRSAADLSAAPAKSRILDVFAEHWYKNEVLQQRYGELSGKLRFDIAPGSTIKIEAPKRAMPGLEQPDMIAMVAQVSFVINAERTNAGTSFSLTNLRTVKEDQDDLKTSPLPPMYKQKWAGGPLAIPEAGVT